MAVTTGAVRRAKLRSNHHHQQTDTQLFTGRIHFLLPSNNVKALKGKQQFKTIIIIIIIISNNNKEEEQQSNFYSFKNTGDKLGDCCFECLYEWQKYFQKCSKCIYFSIT